MQGRKRHIVTDTLGLLLVVMVTAASVQDRDGGAEIFKRVHKLCPSLRHVFADGGYAGRLVAKATRYWKLSVASPPWYLPREFGYLRMTLHGQLKQAHWCPCTRSMAPRSCSIE